MFWVRHIIGFFIIIKVIYCFLPYRYVWKITYYELREHCMGELTWGIREHCMRKCENIVWENARTLNIVSEGRLSSSWVTFSNLLINKLISFYIQSCLPAHQIYRILAGRKLQVHCIGKCKEIVWENAMNIEYCIVREIVFFFLSDLFKIAHYEIHIFLHSILIASASNLPDTGKSRCWELLCTMECLREWLTSS